MPNSNIILISDPKMQHIILKVIVKVFPCSHLFTKDCSRLNCLLNKWNQFAASVCHWRENQRRVIVSLSSHFILGCTFYYHNWDRKLPEMERNATMFDREIKKTCWETFSCLNLIKWERRENKVEDSVSPSQQDFFVIFP